MEELGVIKKVEQPTDWCAGIVVVPKPNGSLRLCVDLTKLNASVRRERHVLPAVDQIVAQLSGAKVFTKLDANAGLWQIKLADDSILYTTFITPFGRFCFQRLPSVSLQHRNSSRRRCLPFSMISRVWCV